MLSRLLSRDMLSVTGKNLRLVQEITKLNPCTASKAKIRAALEVYELVVVPPHDQWRLPYLTSLLSQRGEAYYAAMEEEEERLTELIDSLVVN